MRPFQQWVLPAGSRHGVPPSRLVVDPSGVAVTVALDGSVDGAWQIEGWLRRRTDPDREVGRRRSRQETVLHLAGGGVVVVMDHDCCAGCGKCGRGSPAARMTSAQIVASAKVAS